MTELEGKTVAVVGLGYVGLPSALSLADAGAQVIGYDINEGRLLDIKSGQVDASSLDRLRLANHLYTGVFELTTEPSALSHAHAVIVCVPTPIDAHQAPDLRALSGACADVVEHATAGQVIVVTSTTYVGCTRELVVAPLAERGLIAGKDVFVAFAPERIDPGTNHLPDDTPRVLGGVTEACTQAATAIVMHTASSIHPVSSPEAAEMTKLVENTFRAVNIALANEFADAAEELGVDVMEVIEAAASKPYGFMPFYPGAGVGGHCIPCDPHYLLWQLRARRHDSPVTRSAMTAIALRPRDVVAKAREVLAEDGTPTRGARILVWGVTYKPGVADLRESPALEIIEELAALGAEVAFSDPKVETLTTPHAGRLVSHPDPAADNWDLVVIHTRHSGVDDAWLVTHPLVLDTTYRR